MTDPVGEEELPPIDAECMRGILGVLEVGRNAPDAVYDDPEVLELLAEVFDVFGGKVQMSGRRRRLRA